MSKIVIVCGIKFNKYKTLLLFLFIKLYDLLKYDT